MNRGLEDEQGAIPAAISIVDVLNGMRRRKFLIFGMTIAAFLMGLTVVNLLQPVYTAESKILVGNLETPFDKVQSVQATGAEPLVSERDLETQMAVMRSDDLGRQVIAALKLHEKPEFNSLLNGMGTVSKLKLMLGFGEDPRLKTPEERALMSYNDDLTVYQVPASNVVAIKVATSKPKFAADIANALAETYVNFTRESGTQPTERARQWLAQQIDGLRKKVAASDATVEQFRTQAGLFQGQSSTLGSQELSELNSQITLAEAAKTDAESRAQSIRALLSKKGTVDASADVLASAVIQSLKQEQTAAQRNVAELSAVYLSNHPKMIAANKQLDNINRRIRSEALKIVEGLEEQASIAAAREQSLRDSLDKAKGKASASNLDDVKLKALEREAQADRVLLETMLARYAEATARLDPSAQPGFARIIQTAGAPKSPSFPKKGPMAVLITVAGFCLALGLSFLLEIMAAATRLNERMFRAQGAAKEAAPLVASAVAVVTPHEAPVQVAEASWQPPPFIQPALAVLPAVLSPASLVATSSLEPVATWFDAEIRKPAPPSLGITSMGAGPGDAASAALALGRLYADRGKRVIILDACPPPSWFQSLAGIAQGPGLSELVAGNADFTKVIARDPKSTAHMLRFGQDQSVGPRHLLLERLKPVLQALSQSYEVVIANFGEAAQSTPVLIRGCGATVILAPATRLSDVTVAAAALRNTGYTSVAHVMIAQAAAKPSAVDLDRLAATA